MLVLSRKLGERLRIGDDIVVTVVGLRGRDVRLGIEAPTDVAIRREEICFEATGHQGHAQRQRPLQPA